MNIGDKFICQLLDTPPVKSKENTFKGQRVFEPNRKWIYGGELMAQGLMAALKTVSEDVEPFTIYCNFLNRGNLQHPNEYRVSIVNDSRSFAHRLVEAYPMSIEDESGKTPNDKAFFRMECSFKKHELDAASFMRPMPDVLSVDQTIDFMQYIDSLVLNDLSDHAKNRVLMFKESAKNAPIEMRFCEPEVILGIKTNPSGHLHCWTRLREVPTAPIKPFYNALLAYCSDALLVWAALTEPRPIAFLVTLNQTIWFHNPDFTPGDGEWILMETRANFVGGFTS